MYSSVWLSLIVLCVQRICVFYSLIYHIKRIHSSSKFLTSCIAPVLNQLSRGFTCHIFIKASRPLHTLMCSVEVISLYLRVSFPRGLVMPGCSHNPLQFAFSQEYFLYPVGQTWSVYVGGQEVGITRRSK